MGYVNATVNYVPIPSDSGQVVVNQLITESSVFSNNFRNQVSSLFTCHMHKCFGSFYTQLSSAKVFRTGMAAIINTWWILAGVTVNGLTFLFLCVGNIDVAIGMKAQRLRTGTCFTEIEIKFIR